jgi:hypothetical protein
LDVRTGYQRALGPGPLKIRQSTIGLSAVERLKLHLLCLTIINPTAQREIPQVLKRNMNGRFFLALAMIAAKTYRFRSDQDL